MEIPWQDHGHPSYLISRTAVQVGRFVWSLPGFGASKPTCQILGRWLPFTMSSSRVLFFLTSLIREVEEPGPGTKERKRRLYEGFTGGSRSANWQLALSAV